jgi:protein-L-isoaspartate O-methyltransferase
MPEEMAAALREVEMPEGAQVLDLGCGKGFTARVLECEFGSAVLGVDGFQPFLEEAMRLTETAGLAHLCRFHHGDIRDVVRQAKRYDVVVLDSVGPCFGGHASTVKALCASMPDTKKLCGV